MKNLCVYSLCRDPPSFPFHSLKITQRRRQGWCNTTQSLWMDTVFTSLTPRAWRLDEDEDLPVGGAWEKRWREKPIPLPLATSRAVQHPFADSAVTKLHRYFKSVSFYLAHGHTICPTVCSVKPQDQCVTGTMGKGCSKRVRALPEPEEEDLDEKWLSWFMCLQFPPSDPTTLYINNEQCAEILSSRNRVVSSENYLLS